jgi:hypothetical protein
MTGWLVGSQVHRTAAALAGMGMYGAYSTLWSVGQVGEDRTYCASGLPIPRARIRNVYVCVVVAGDGSCRWDRGGSWMVRVLACCQMPDARCPGWGLWGLYGVAMGLCVPHVCPLFRQDH